MKGLRFFDCVTKEIFACYFAVFSTAGSAKYRGTWHVSVKRLMPMFGFIELEVVGEDSS